MFLTYFTIISPTMNYHIREKIICFSFVAKLFFLLDLFYFRTINTLLNDIKCLFDYLCGMKTAHFKG